MKNAESPAYVLDSFALLAYLQGEPAGKIVQGLLEDARVLGASIHMTEINYMEVKYILIRARGEAAWRREAPQFAALPITYHPCDRTLADAAVKFKIRYALSPADACAAALSFTLRCPVVTGDAEFKPLAKEIKIKWI